MRKQFIQGLLTGVTAVLVGAAATALLVMKLGAVPVNADKQPPVLEARLLGLALHASVARHAENRPNPLPTTEENLVAGAEIYAQMCAKCHGRPNAGPSIYGASFYPPARNSSASVHRSGTLLDHQARSSEYRHARLGQTAF